MNIEILGVAVGAILTLLVFSYLIHDTFLFRLAQAVFVGVAIGYGASLIIQNIILKSLVLPLLNREPDSVFLLFPLVLGILLFVFNLDKRGEFRSLMGNLPIAYLLGVGAALALVGALSGTLIPQFLRAIESVRRFGNLLEVVNGLIMLIGTAGALLAFRFTTNFQQQPLRLYASIARVWGGIGRGFIFITLGALFASVLTARVSVLIGQVYFVINDFPAALAQLFK
ncbi:MAG TPA: hypothetical protein VIX58_12375 [Anaerolineae bacterium]